jgi:hypothetical protein
LGKDFSAGIVKLKRLVANLSLDKLALKDTTGHTRFKLNLALRGKTAIAKASTQSYATSS